MERIISTKTSESNKPIDYFDAYLTSINVELSVECSDFPIALASFIIENDLVAFVDVISPAIAVRSCVAVLSCLDPGIDVKCDEAMIKVGNRIKESQHDVVLDICWLPLNSDLRKELTTRRDFVDPVWKNLDYLISLDKFFNPIHLIKRRIKEADILLGKPVGDAVVKLIYKNVMATLKQLTDSGIFACVDPGYIIYKDNIKRLPRFKDQEDIELSYLKIKPEVRDAKF